MSTLLMSLPIQAGQTDAARAFAQECVGPWADAYDASEQRIGIPTENWYLLHTPSGDVFVIQVEGADLNASMGAFIVSQDPFDLWFKQRLAAITGIDLNAGPPPPEAVAETLAEYKAAVPSQVRQN